MIEIVKITNPHWIGTIGPQIAKYHERLKMDGVTYESLYTYFCQVAQFGGEGNEFWVAVENGEPAGFAQWQVSMLPFVGHVSLQNWYSWSKNKEVARVLLKGFIDFGVRHKAKYYNAHVAGLARVELAERYMKEFGVEGKRTPDITVIGERVVNAKENETAKV